VTSEKYERMELSRENGRTQMIKAHDSREIIIAAFII